MLKQTLLATAMIGLSSMPVFAETTYRPDVANFDGGDGIALGADPAFDPIGTNTIEFWVAAGWSSDPGYDPVILSNTGASGTSYLVSILRDRDGLGILAGDTEIYTAFDFSDGRLSHVAIVEGEGALSIIINGQVRSVHEVDFQELPETEFFIGSADGQTAPFIGAIGQLRIWREALSRETLVAFIMADVLSPTKGDHPLIDALSVMSDFDDRTVLIADAPAKS